MFCLSLSMDNKVEYIYWLLLSMDNEVKNMY